LTQTFVESCVAFEVVNLSAPMVQRLPTPNIINVVTVIAKYAHLPVN